MVDAAQNGAELPKGRDAFIRHVKANKVDVALWLTRVFTILFCLGYVVPIFTNANTMYYKALMANAATSALRLHQRLPRISLSRQFLGQLTLEDSCHYLFFSLIFLYVAPIIFVIIPIGLFALLHAASYSLTLLDTLGQNSWWGARLMISLVEFQSRNILRMVSLAEIILMPFCVAMIFFGRVGLLTPFVYYQFLTLRYTSRRNPYTRNMFHEMRQWAEQTATKPMVPKFVAAGLLFCVKICLRLAPQEVAAEQ